MGGEQEETWLGTNCGEDFGFIYYGQRKEKVSGRGREAEAGLPRVAGSRKGSGGFYFAAVFLRCSLCRVAPPLLVFNSGSFDNAHCWGASTTLRTENSYVTPIIPLG